jgi:hypothetical protein
MQYHVFKSGVSSMRMVLPNGQTINFVGGEYVTPDERIANYLKKEITNNTPNLWQDQEDLVRDAEKIDPMVAIRAAMREELLRELAQNAGVLPDSEQQKLVPTSTTDIGQVTLAPVIATTLAAEDAAAMLDALKKG